MGEGRGVYRVLVKRPLGRPRCRWKDNIKINLREIKIDGVNSIGLAQDRVQWQTIVSMAMNFGFHKERLVWQAEWLSAFQRLFWIME
jgi:hypothetical protein